MKSLADKEETKMITVKELIWDLVEEQRGIPKFDSPEPLIRFSTGPDNEYIVLSIYSDDTDIWIDLEKIE